LLLYNEEAFIQVIEGKREIIKNLFGRIFKDSRHSNMVKLLGKPIEKRAFPTWFMGSRMLDKQQTLKIPDHTDFIQNKNAIIDCSEAAMHLLTAFENTPKIKLSGN